MININIFIFYPEVFKVKSKFERKVSRIIKNLNNYNIYYLSDPNNFIECFFRNTAHKTALHKISDLNSNNITHAIIFDDGEEFVDNYQSFINSPNINTRIINIDITRVVNIDKDTQYKSIKSSDTYQYIGRGSYWGNPYSMYDFSSDGDNSREDVIRKFKYDFDHNKFIKKEKDEVYKLVGKRLGCFCKPEACHGDILADFLNSWDDGK